VTNIGCWKEIGRTYSKYFDQIRPATTVVEVSKLINPQILVEIEADAVSPQIPK
jgi:enamine deaminase RidA (YjgF/YER057c/UK114 family)